LNIVILKKNKHYLNIPSDQLINKSLCLAQQQGKSMVAYLLPESNKITVLIGLEEAFDGHLENQKTGFIFSGFLGHNISKNIIADYIFTYSENHIEVIYSIDPHLVDKITIAEEIPQLQKAPETIHDDQYQQKVADAIKQIENGHLKKVIIARQKRLEIEETNPGVIFNKLSNGFKNSFRSLLYSPDYGMWVGASPEILVSVDENKRFKTVALAGTQKLSEKLSLQEAVWKQKEIEEQALVSRYIINCFKTLRMRNFEEEGPKTIVAGDLLHLKTVFQADTQNDEVKNLASNMLQLLHPTSAIGGMPRQEAIDYINQHEGFDRQLFAGYFGPVHVQNRTDLYVNIRCARLYQNQAVLFAGAGITSDSVPEKELQETEIKMQVIGSVLKS
jgi:isochorismate synthase